MKKYYKKVVGKKEMIEQLSKLSDKIDTEATLDVLTTAGPRRLYLVDLEGRLYPADNFKKFVSFLNVITELEFLPKLCFNKGQVYHLFSREDYWKEEKEEVEVVTQDETLEETEEVSEKELSSIDKYRDLLDEEDIKGSKQALHDAIKEDLGIEIKKNQKFESMLEELESKLEG